MIARDPCNGYLFVVCELLISKINLEETVLYSTISNGQSFTEKLYERESNYYCFSIFFYLLLLLRAVVV